MKTMIEVFGIRKETINNELKIQDLQVFFFKI